MSALQMTCGFSPGPSGTPVLETGRLLLRAPKLDDAKVIALHINSSAAADCAIKHIGRNAGEKAESLTVNAHLGGRDVNGAAIESNRAGAVGGDDIAFDVHGSAGGKVEGRGGNGGSDRSSNMHVIQY